MISKIMKWMLNNWIPNIIISCRRFKIKCSTIQHLFLCLWKIFLMNPMLEIIPKMIKIHSLQIFFSVLLITRHFLPELKVLWQIGPLLGNFPAFKIRRPLLRHGLSTIFHCTQYNFNCWKLITTQWIVKTTATDCRLHSNDFVKEKYAKRQPSRLCLLYWPHSSYNQERAVEVITWSQRQMKRKKSKNQGKVQEKEVRGIRQK
jgi:hypothetical protein